MAQQRDQRRAPPPAQAPVALLPLIPEQLELHPLTAALLTTTAFLDIAEQGQVDEASSRQVLERVGLYVQRLSDDDVEQLAADLDRLSEHAEQAGWPEEAREFVDQFLSYCGFALDEDEDAEGAESDDEDAGSDAGEEDQ